MIEDFKKSVNNILYERLVSPLFGTFLLSWCVWNWKIIYLTLFVDNEEVSGNKIDFIISNYYDNNDLLLWPAISTLILLVIYPFLAVGAYYVSLRFKKWKIDIRNTQENLQVLNIEDSIELREKIRNQAIRFDNLLSNKNEEIETFKTTIENYKNQLGAINKGVSELPLNTREDIYLEEYNQLKANEKLYELFGKIAPRAQRELTMFTDSLRLSTAERKMFDYFLANDLIEKLKSNQYKFTEKGKLFNKYRLDDTIIN
ncbi:hypothetical protein [Dokdonia sp. LLG6352-1]|uniref:hypothetical protein n=1 Tax=Dokdonia sp. LLG6352-1 TaxID=3160831 RepID=UPI003868B24B